MARVIILPEAVEAQSSLYNKEVVTSSNLKLFTILTMGSNNENIALVNSVVNRDE
ncbi:34292_t:CDS:1, partial [Gigaspora margarita]